MSNSPTNDDGGGTVVVDLDVQGVV